jgi:mRNA interferase HigB
MGGSERLRGGFFLACPARVRSAWKPLPDLGRNPVSRHCPWHRHRCQIFHRMGPTTARRPPFNIGKFHLFPEREHATLWFVNVIARRTLVTFWGAHPETRSSLEQWLKRARAAEWTSMNDLMRDFPKAKALNAERARFEIAGGNYRLVVAIKFTARIVFVKFIGTHAEYDRIDALTVAQY